MSSLTSQETLSLIATLGFLSTGLVGLLFRTMHDRWLVWSLGFSSLLVFALVVAPATRTLPAFLTLAYLLFMAGWLVWVKVRAGRG